MNQTLILSIVELIESQLPKLLSINEIAKQSGYSRSYIQHQFKATTGYSISYYQRARILSMAASRLAEGKYRVLDVAIEFGFESQEAFARAFRQHMSATPSCLLGQNIWAERIHFKRLCAERVQQLSTLQSLSISIFEQPETRWGCFVFSVSSPQRDIDVIFNTIDLAYRELLAMPNAESLTLHRAQILEFREHNQEATSTYPMSIAVPFAKGDAIPGYLLEIRLPSCQLAALSLPSPSYVPAVFYPLNQRLYQEKQHYFAGLPSFWDYDYQTGQLHHKCQIEPIENSQSDATWDLFDEHNEISLNHHLCSTISCSIPVNKRAGTRRLSTLLEQWDSCYSNNEDVSVVFHHPMEKPNSQYHYSLGLLFAESSKQFPADNENDISCQGKYLLTQWRGNDVWQLENQLEKFYLRLSQHRQYQYRVAPEIFQQFAFNDGYIEFELLTPIKYRRASRQKSSWAV
ncbi:helix-turn-helix transcriptional regulator [Vibrio sp. 404]|uniref:Helix-turn-helix transcriptional regulator n=1 Tax=Vibrio marinisediminis TaxID=2758441 RepID=A0A7W2IUU3_9VIBR|nr:AraC family transcriptional regulator [Vibrio marinisediminis]MBA5763749.1 helix-turn-helix transcriptional regulator [Vibrio marinisediminis]